MQSLLQAVLAFGSNDEVVGFFVGLAILVAIIALFCVRIDSTDDATDSTTGQRPPFSLKNAASQDHAEPPPVPSDVEPTPRESSQLSKWQGYAIAAAVVLVFVGYRMLAKPQFEVDLPQTGEFGIACGQSGSAINRRALTVGQVDGYEVAMVDATGTTVLVLDWRQVKSWRRK